jgi:hypothetical protein
MELRLDPADTRVPALERELGVIGLPPILSDDWDYAPAEVEHAELLHLHIRGLCGESFGYWAERLGLPSDTPVINKRAMGKKDIALTYGFQPIVSERLRLIFLREHLTGWETQSVRHAGKSDTYPPFYVFTSTNLLPPLASSTQIHTVHHPPAASESRDPLAGSTAHILRGPLEYSRKDLGSVCDFNHTHEIFGEVPQRHRRFVITPRAWSVLKRHQIRLVEVEPIIIKA